MKFTIYRDSKREFRWQLLARNGRVIADSGEGYKRKGDCERDIARVMGSAAAKIVDKSQ